MSTSSPGRRRDPSLGDSSAPRARELSCPMPSSDRPGAGEPALASVSARPARRVVRRAAPLLARGAPHAARRAEKDRSSAGGRSAVLARASARRARLVRRAVRRRRGVLTRADTAPSVLTEGSGARLYMGPDDSSKFVGTNPMRKDFGGATPRAAPTPPGGKRGAFCGNCGARPVSLRGVS